MNVELEKFLIDCLVNSIDLKLIKKMAKERGFNENITYTLLDEVYKKYEDYIQEKKKEFNHILNFRVSADILNDIARKNLGKNDETAIRAIKTLYEIMKIDYRKEHEYDFLMEDADDDDEEENNDDEDFPDIIDDGGALN